MNRLAATLLVLGLLAGPAARAMPPAPGPEIARACADESLPWALAACIGHLADQRLMEIEARIAHLGATAASVRLGVLWALRHAASAAQRQWRSEMEDTCRKTPGPVERQQCRLAGALARTALLERVIANAFAAQGTTERPAPVACDLLIRLLRHPRAQVDCTWPGLLPDAPRLAFR